MFFDNVPSRKMQVRSPENRCLLCGDRVVVSPECKNWLWADMGAVTRLCHRFCSDSDDDAEAI